MSDVRRLVEGGASPAELALLEAAQADRPADDGARMRTLAALAAGAAATGALAAGAGKAGGAIGIASRLLSRSLLKWILSLAVCTGLGVSAVVYLRSPGAASKVVTQRAPTTVTTPPSEVAPPTPAVPEVVTGGGHAPPTDAPRPNAPALVAKTPDPSPPSAAVPTAEPPRTASPAPPPAPPPPATHADLTTPATGAPPALASQSLVRGASAGAVDSRPPPSSSAASASLASEIALVDQARAALAMRDPRAALAALAQYDRGFPSGAFRQESTVMRIEALLQSNERQRAETLANAFIRADPSGPYAKRVREMLAK